jgi:stringent starvation protein B
LDKKGPEKKERLLSALEQGMVMIHLDARRPGVLVPPSLNREAHLRLNLSYRFDPPDLTVGDWGIRSTLSFSGARFRVAVPWSALFAITSYATKEFWMYPDDMPKELIQQAALAKARRPAAPNGHEKSLAEKALASVRRVSEPPSDDRGPDPSDKPPRSGARPHLRVVK